MTAFKRTLRDLVSASGDVTHAQIATRAAISASYLSRLLSGASTHPSVQIVTALDKALNAGGSLMATLTQSPWSDLSDRTGTPPDHATTQALRTVLAGLRRLDDQVGAHIVTPLAMELYVQARRFHRDARTTQLRADLLATTAEISALIGWLRWDDSDPEAGRTWWSRAAEQAMEAGASDLLAVIAARRSLAAWLRGDASRAVELARMAGRRAEHPMAKLHAFQFELRAAAAARDAGLVTAARRAIDAAQKATDQADPVDDPPFLYFVRGAGWSEVQLGTALARLGEVREADSVLVSAAHGLASGGYRRDAGTAWARVAAVRAAAGDREGAAAAAVEAAAIGVASASTAQELASVTE